MPGSVARVRSVATSISDRPGGATRDWILQGVIRTAFVAAATPLMFLVISWVASALAPPVHPDGNYTFSAAQDPASIGDYAAWTAGLAMYLSIFTAAASAVGSVVGLALGLIAAAVDMATFRRIPPAALAVVITLAVWIAAIATSRALGQENWIVEDLGQLLVSSPFILGLVTLAVVPLARAHRRGDDRSASGAQLTDRRDGARA